MGLRNTPIRGPMSFGQAMDAIKDYKKIARTHWDRKGMFVYFRKGSYNGTEQDGYAFKGGVLASIKGMPVDLFNKDDKGVATRMPRVMYSTLNDKMMRGAWVPLENDMLADDWFIVK